MLKFSLLVGCFITVQCLKKCYHKKCKTTEYGYTYCDQELYECTEYDDIRGQGGSCTYKGYASAFGYKHCLDSETCSTDSYTGRAKCVDDGVRPDGRDWESDWESDWNSGWDSDDFYEEGMSIAITIVIVVICVIVGIILICCIACFCLGKACFKNRSRNHGRVIQVNLPSYTGQTTTNAQGGKHGPPTQYPPTQYPPAQYPPGKYPPAAQYPPPPTQYPPPAGGQYPPTGGYPPAQIQYPPPPADHQPPLPGEITEPPAPPPYESAPQPAENPYVQEYKK